MKAYVEVRRQHAKKGRSGWSGPDTYVAVQVVPDGVERLKQLNTAVAKKRGIRIKYFGEGYSQNSGPRSSLGHAIQYAEAFAASINQPVEEQACHSTT